MSIPVFPRGQIIWTDDCYVSWISSEISNIYDEEVFDRFIRLRKKGKEEMRTAKAGIYYLYILGQVEFLEFLDYGRAKPIIRKERVSAPADYDLLEQHAQGTLTGRASGDNLLALVNYRMWVAQDTQGSYARMMTSASCHGAP